MVGAATVGALVGAVTGTDWVGAAAGEQAARAKTSTAMTLTKNMLFFCEFDFKLRFIQSSPWLFDMLIKHTEAD